MSDKTKRTLKGTVISAKMTKTIVVRVTRRERHPQYGRVLKVSQKFKVHTPSESPRVGDWVEIEETRPISKEKRWRLVKVLRQSEDQPDPQEAAILGQESTS
tara:strand:- start:3 stop:308 length:306 start_codon:yes stop_codon:yes gene_type:complete